MKTYFDEIKRLLKNKVFVLSLLILAVIAYGYGAVNTSISVDDLEVDRYVGSGQEMLMAGRFGIWFWAFIQGPWKTDYTMDILSIGLLILAAMNFCILFRRISGEKIRDDALTVFACMLLTYPLVVEIWEYTGSNMHIHGSVLFVSWSLLLLHKLIHSHGKGRLWLLLPVAAMLTLVCAGYESVVAVYIFLVFAILALQVMYGSGKEKTFKEILRQGLIYAGALIAGLVLRVVIHRLALAVLDLEAITNGQTKILWLEGDPIRVAFSMITGLVRNYVLMGFKYLPITVLVVCGVIFVVLGILCARKHGAILLLPVLGMLLSLVIMSFVQGMVSPYRICQVFGMFCAFTAMLLIHLLPEAGGKKWLRTAAVVLFGVLCLQQATFVNYFLELNYRRSLEEAQTVHQISLDLQREHDTSKPVVFVGKYRLSESVREAASLPEDSLRWKVYKGISAVAYRAIGTADTDINWNRMLPETNIQSVIDWSAYSFEKSQESMQKLFSYYGYDYVLGDSPALYPVAQAYAEETAMPGYPYDGYIADAGDYIVVNLGPID